MLHFSFFKSKKNSKKNFLKSSNKCPSKIEECEIKKFCQKSFFPKSQETKFSKTRKENSINKSNKTEKFLKYTHKQ